jgi:hypothetical protein
MSLIMSKNLRKGIMSVHVTRGNPAKEKKEQ